MQRLSGVRNSNYGMTGERLSRGRSIEGRTSLLQPGFALKNRRSSSEASDSIVTGIPRKTQLPIRRSRSQLSVSTAATPRRETRSPCQPSNSRSTTPCDGRYTGIYNVGSSSKTRRDVRNFTDKRELAAAIIRVTNYFARHKMSVNFRQPLMLKAFVDLFNVLVFKLDAQTATSTSNYVEEIPFIMRFWGYPGSLASSWLKSANTQHALPHVMALLAWLVDLLEEVETFDDGVMYAQDPHDGNLAGVPPKGHISERPRCPVSLTPDFMRLVDITPERDELFNYFKMAYAKWNNFEAEDTLTEKFEQKLVEARLPNIDDSKTESLEKEVAALCAKCSVDDGNVAKKKECEEVFSLLQAEITKIKSHIKLLENYDKNCDEKIEGLQNKILETEGKFVNVQNHTAQLRQQVAKQEMSLEERNKIIQSCEQLEELLRTKERCISELAEMAYDVDRKLALTRTNVNNNLAEYNKLLVVESCSLPDLSQFQIRSNAIHDSYKHETLQIDKDIETLAKKFSEERAEVQESLNEITAQIDELRESLNAAAEETAKENSKVKQVECDIASLKIAMKEDEAKFREEEKHLQAETECISNDEKLNALKERVTALNTKAEVWNHHIQQLKEKASRFFERNTKISQDYCTAVQNLRRVTAERIREMIEKRTQRSRD